MSMVKKKAKKLNRTQIRNLIIKDLKQKRYFFNINNIKSDTDIQFKQKEPQKLNSTLSDKMWIYLQMKKNLDINNENTVDKTADYMKYLNENKTDIKKWLEFINYQSNINLNAENQTAYHERKISIFEKAIKENPASFRLRIELFKIQNELNRIQVSNKNAVDKTEV